ncbi:MAG: hypothetical protein ACTS22_06550 [Phycisphaerales bacterium]
MGETIQIMCPSLRCRKILAVPVSARGKTVRCKACQSIIRIPSGPGSVTKAGDQKRSA